MANTTNNPAPHAGEKEAPAIPRDGETPGMGRPPQEPSKDGKSGNPPPRTKGFDKDQPSEPAGGPNPDRYKASPPKFDEGESKPAPIERTGDDGVRSAPPKTPASNDQKRRDEHSTEATLEPGQGTEPERNTM